MYNKMYREVQYDGEWYATIVPTEPVIAGSMKVRVAPTFEYQPMLSQIVTNLALEETLGTGELATMISWRWRDTYAVYPDPVRMLDAINMHIRATREYWDHIYETTRYEYQPIENYDLHEESTDTTTSTDTRTVNLQHVISDSRTTTDTPDVQTVTTTDQYGYNSSTAIPTEKDSTTRSGTETRTDSGNATTTDTGTNTDVGNHKVTGTLRRHGNIGITSSQDMIKQEREVTIKLAEAFVESLGRFFIVA